MARLGRFIDVTTLVSIVTNGTLTFAHGLPSAPDFVLCVAAATTGSSSNWQSWTPTFDATNVTVQNTGQVQTVNVRVISVVAHSLIR